MAVVGLALVRYTFDRYGWSFGRQTMQAAEKANEGFRLDLLQTGNQNGHRSFTEVSAGG
jgi:hypothetical protein